MEKRAQALRLLLDSYGIQPAVVGGPQRETQIRGVRQQPARPRPTGRRRRQKAKLADVAASVLQRHNGRAHGSVIVEELQQAGYLLNVAAPDSNVSTALGRDSRFARAKDARNTWLLVA
jgi:hypothetical protein